MRVTARARLCACGCGREIPDRTTRGLPQKYAHGHNASMSLDDLIVVQDCGYDTDCWLWKGGTNSRGYGRCRWNGRMQPAHRAFYERAGGTVPEGLQLDHLCRVPRCVNPGHLEPVTGVENVRRGAAAKLTQADVDAIRAVRTEALSGLPPTREGARRRRVPNGRAIRERLAEQYGVSADQIKHIWGGRSWR
jgi:hypothetical protein